MPNIELTIANTNAANGEHWVPTQPMEKADIDSIYDPEGGNTKDMPTSIPSPFARLDLTRAAFSNVYRLKEKASPNDKKLVSEALDIAQIFFNYENLKDKISIIRWDKNIGIDSLKNSHHKGHNHLGTALNLFLSQDGGQGKIVSEDPNSGGYNFNYMDSIFILKYDDGLWSGIIGGTSPSTLFFSAPNNLSNVDIRFNNDKLFDEELCPLHEREENFQRFMYGISKLPNFSDHFKEVYDYIHYSVKQLANTNRNRQLYGEIGDGCNNIGQNYISEKFTNLVTDNGDLVEIIKGFRVYKAASNIDKFKESDFILKSTKFEELNPEALCPMVLQDNYQGRMKYISDFWDRNQSVPSFDEKNWRNNERKLPGQAYNYPYITVSDFLEPYLIRLVYPTDKSNFYDGGLEVQSGEPLKNYVLPLTSTFFDFFDVEDITENRGKVSLKMEEKAGGNVKVLLSIFLKQTEPPIVFERTYRSSLNDFPVQPDQTQKEGGAIVELRFGLNIMPFIKITTPTFNPLYKIQVLDNDVLYSTFENDYSLSFYNDNNIKIHTDDPKKRRRKVRDADSVESSYYTAKNNFDYIQVNAGRYRGILVPKFPKREIGNETFAVAVDFGTTSTTIRLKSGQQPSKTFTVDEKIVGYLNDKSKSASFFESSVTTGHLEWVPQKMGESLPNKFPIRTVLADNQPNWTARIDAFSDVNPAFDYHLRPYKNGNIGSELTTNLKWSNLNEGAGNGQKKVGAFIESLLYMIRNKVLLNNGRLENTKLVWFFPQSMEPFRLSSFSNLWNEKFRNIISPNSIPYRISESLAPYYGYETAGAADKIFSSYTPAAIIDIGGGTTDFAVFKDSNPILISSVRFAGNSVLGDKNLNSFYDNGLIKKYKPIIERTLTDLSLTEYIKVLNSIADTRSTEDMISFFFSLNDNPEVISKGGINFQNLLSEDQDLKIIFLLFYCSIIYHLAKLMKTKELAIPGHIAFSGNGSKLINILTDERTTIGKLATLIFDKVYDTTSQDPIKVRYIDNPKEITSIGGVEHITNNTAPAEQIANNEQELLDKIKVVLKGTSDDQFVQQNDNYNSIDETTMNSVKNEVDSFFDLIFSLNDSFPFTKNFGIVAFNKEQFSKILKSDILQNLAEELKVKKAEVHQNNQLEETLFFYPISGSLNTLASEIVKEKMG